MHHGIVTTPPLPQSLTKRLGAFPWSFALEAVLGTVEESALGVHRRRRVVLVVEICCLSMEILFLI